jgi:hypothetical protein
LGVGRAEALAPDDVVGGIDAAVEIEISRKVGERLDGSGTTSREPAVSTKARPPSLKPPGPSF